ncbi:MAG: tetratricopeptide repeat protein [Ignavibacteriales bacterium]|nr:tetratricopeptide repeat protein [Ignavibacteriales bacterium]
MNIREKILLIILFLFVVANINIAQPEKNLQNKFMLAQSYEQSGQIEKAKSIYEEIYNIEPTNIQYVYALNGVYVKLKEYESSVKLLEKYIVHSPMEIEAYGFLGSTYYLMDDTEKAFSTWDKGTQLNSNSIVGYRVIVNYILENRLFDKAIEILNKGAKVSNDPTIFSFDLARLYSMTMNFSAAAEEYCKILSHRPEQIEAVKREIIKYLTKTDAIEQTIKQVEEYSEDKPVFLEFLSYIYIQAEYFDKAFEIIKEIENNTTKNGSRIYNFAEEMYRQNYFEMASISYEYLINNYPNSTFYAAAKIGYAKTYEATLDQKYSNDDFWKPYFLQQPILTDEYSKIINIYNEIIERQLVSEPIIEAKYRIGIINYEKYNNYQEASEKFKDIITTLPSSNFALLSYSKLAEILILNNELDTAFSYYGKIVKSNTNQADLKNSSLFYQAKIKFWQGEFKQSLELLKNITKNLSDDYANNAIELSILINTVKGDSLNLAEYSKADLLAEQNKFQEAVEKFRVLSINSKLFLINTLSKYKYAEMCIALSNYPAAIQSLEDIVNNESFNILNDKALYLLANTYFYGIKDNDKAFTTCKKILEFYPNSLYVEKTRSLITIIQNKGENI